jgi:hypothetical protein
MAFQGGIQAYESLTHMTCNVNTVTYTDAQVVTPPAASHPEGT